MTCVRETRQTWCRLNFTDVFRAAATINMRLDIVEELLQKEDVYWDLVTLLPQFKDLGNFLSL